MSHAAIFSEVRTRGEAAREEAIGWAVGLGFTFMLFFGMAHFENIGASGSPTEIEDLRMIALPMEPPPPPPKRVEQASVREAELPFSGLDVGASDSPVMIAVVPADLEAIIPSTTNPPRAAIQFAHVHTELKPKMGIDFDVAHIYQESELDQLARAVYRAAPTVPPRVRGGAKTLRTVLLLVIDQRGRVESSRISQSSGNAEFDAIIAQVVKEEWVFSPAIRRGKKVKCLAHQAFRVNFTSGSPFEVHR